MINVAHQYLVAIVIDVIQDKGVEGVNSVDGGLTVYEVRKEETEQYVDLAEEKRSKQRVASVSTL